MGSCQNYDPFLGTLNIRGRIIIGIQKGAIILTTTLISFLRRLADNAQAIHLSGVLLLPTLNPHKLAEDPIETTEIRRTLGRKCRNMWRYIRVVYKGIWGKVAWERKLTYEPLSKLLVSPLITPIVVPYTPIQSPI